MPFDLTFWSSIGAPAITGLVTSSLVVGLAQVVFKARFDRQLETLKGRLTAENAREVERIRTEGVIAAERFRKSYSLMAERQAEAVEGIYGHLAEVHLALSRLVSPGRFGGEPSDVDLLQALHDKRWTGMDHFRHKRLFLPADLGAEIDALYREMMTAEIGFRYQVGGMERSERDWKAQSKLWDKADGEIATTLRSLEAKFRQLLQGGMI